MKSIVKITLLIVVLILSISFVSANENITAEQSDLLETSLHETNLTNTVEEEPLSAENEYVLTTTIINDNIYAVTNNNTYTSTNETIYTITSDSLLTYADEVEQSSTADRTFKMGKYKITLSKSQYSILLYAKQKDIEDYEEYSNINSYNKYGPYTVLKHYNHSFDNYEKGLVYYIKKYTGKTVKQKIGYGFKGYKYIAKKTFTTKAKAEKYKKTLKYSYKYVIKKVKVKNKVRYRVYKQVSKFKKVVTKNAKVYIRIQYGAGQSGQPEKYTMGLYSQYENPGYELVSGDIFCYKISNNFKGLKTAKTRYN
ncbi:hypothetical protein [uncultured Methanobrevibacter sp.]|uniref:hypothetical protein n=1 Tax=uncultured Methanobrevibacter sp. TaxID=253161 RepID=UPI0026007964|nr:hypothetical protein [uncultured Methanobrevibacter sp.]